MALHTTEVTVNKSTHLGLSLLSSFVTMLTGTGTDGELYAAANDGGFLVYIVNSHSSAQDVTFVTQATLGGFAVADNTVSIPNNTQGVLVGPFDPAVYNDASGKLKFWSTLTVGTLKFVAFRD